MSTQVDHYDPLEVNLPQEDVSDMEEEVQSYVQRMDAFEPNGRKYFEPLGKSTSQAVPLVEKPPQLEQKQLPDHLRYAYLGQSSTLPVIIYLHFKRLKKKSY